MIFYLEISCECAGKIRHKSPIIIDLLRDNFKREHFQFFENTDRFSNFHGTFDISLKERLFTAGKVEEKRNNKVKTVRSKSSQICCVSL